MGQSEQKEKQKPDFKDVENGPLDEANRECRDVFCCILFVANCVIMFILSIIGYSNGNTRDIFRTVDTQGNICGTSNNDSPTKDFPYLYFANPTSIYTYRYCVKECPTFDSGANTVKTVQVWNHATNQQISSTWGAQINDDGEIISPAGVSEVSSLSTGTFIGYGSSPTIDRFCLPNLKVLTVAFKSYTESMSAALTTGGFSNMITDVDNNWQYLFVGVVFGIVFSLLFMLLLRCLVGCVVWGSIFGIIGLFIALGLMFFYNAGSLGVEVEYLGVPDTNGSQYYQTYGIISFCIAGVLIILLICCCNRLRLAVGVCKVAGQFVVRVCQVTLVPIVLGLVLIAVWALCLLAMVFLLASATFVAEKDITGDYQIFTSISDYTETNLLRLYYFIFATLWCNALIQALGIFIVAASVCMWYYNHEANSELDSPVTRSFKMGLRYHFGSLAFGSFILAVVQFLQFCVEIFKKQAEKTGADQNKCFEIVLNCVRCCLQCVERIVKFINQTAYIQIALRGKNFCMAAKDGFEIVWSNGMRYLIVAGVGAIVMFLGRVFISLGATFAFYLMITFVDSIKNGIIEPLYLLLIVFIISFAIATLFISIYSIAIDTILACFIVDEMNVGKGNKAIHGPAELYDLIDHDQE